MKKIIKAIGLMLLPFASIAQIASSKTDSIKVKSTVKPYSEVITAKAKTSYGLLTVHKVEDRYFFEIPDAILNRDLLIVNRIGKAAAGGGYGGDEINENVIQFAKGLNNKLFIKKISYTSISNDTSANGMYRSVLNSNVQPLVAAFDIKAYAKDASASVIDVTDYMNGDNDLFFFDPTVKSSLSLGAIQPDRSYTLGINVYPMNVEIKTVKTYLKTPKITPLGPLGGGGFATYELNSSIVLLPQTPMRYRYLDARVGYFATGYVDFDANPQGIEETAMITRWRLEPKPEDIPKYLRGELVEPKTPIVYYIDPATPQKWVHYLMQGVNDWQAAFEQAGFKNAIIAKAAPTDDSTWNIDDARHNVIIYKPSTEQNASGPQVHDPRSGEIIETHINWYHNVMELLHDWYMIQTAAVDPKARTMNFSDELMGQLIRYTVSHEIGHTLGLRHNFGSSSTVPVENLRNKDWVEAHGHTPSIMDYARFNYVAQPEDNISEKGLFPRIGDYDKWAIEWGYRWWPEMNKEQEKAKLNKWIIDSLSGNARLWFGTETNTNDPRTQSEDLGDNAMKAGAYGIKNLQRILPHLTEWTKMPNEDNENTARLYKQLLKQFKTYMYHVVRNIGGVMTTPKSTEQSGSVFTYVPKERQKEAIAFLQQQLFTTPKWLLNKELFDKTGEGSILTISKQQDPMFTILFNYGTIYKMLQAEGDDPEHAYTFTEMLTDLQSGIFSELKSRRSIDIYRRNLQKAFIEKLISLFIVPPQPEAPPGTTLANPNIRNSDMMSIAKDHAKHLMNDIKVAAPFFKDGITRSHLQDCWERLDNTVNPKK